MLQLYDATEQEAFNIFNIFDYVIERANKLLCFLTLQCITEVVVMFKVQ